MRFASLVAFAACAFSTVAAQTDTTRRDTAFLAPTIVSVVRTTMELHEAPYAIGVTTRDEIQRGRPGLALDEALTRLAALDAGQARIVELRYFGGLSIEEAAAVLDVSVDVVKREWRTAKLWLFRALTEARDGAGPLESD